jgi:hypothetical protein
MKSLFVLMSLLMAFQVSAQVQPIASVTSELNVSLTSQGPAQAYGLYPCAAYISNPGVGIGSDKMILTIRNRFNGAEFVHTMVINQNQVSDQYFADPEIYEIIDVKIVLNSQYYGARFEIRKCYSKSGPNDPQGSFTQLDSTIEVRSGSQQYLYDSELTAKVYSNGTPLATFELFNFQPYTVLSQTQNGASDVDYIFEEMSYEERDPELRSLEIKLLTTIKELTINP